MIDTHQVYYLTASPLYYLIYQPKEISNKIFESFLSKIWISEDGCWIWMAAKKSSPGLPYGFFNGNGKKNELAHRVSYKWWIGPILKGMDIHHECENPSCVNPYHLEQITRYDHLMIGNSPVAINANKTHCPKGHFLSGNNLWMNNQGRRTCRQCNNDRSRKWKKDNNYSRSKYK